MKSRHDRFYRQALPLHRQHRAFEAYMTLSDVRWDEILFGQSFTLRGQRIDPQRVRPFEYPYGRFFEVALLGHELGHRTPSVSQPQP